jgi:hypothetical protein
MANFRKHAGAAAGNGPSPILWNVIPPEVVGNLQPEKGFMIWDDFLGIPQSTTAYNGYTVTNTNGTLVTAQEEGGALVLTVAGSDNDLIQLQSSEAFFVDVDSTLVAEARIKVVDADQQDVFFGLSITDTSIGASVPTDLIGLGLEDGSADIVYICSKDSGGSYTDTGDDAADATYVRLGFKVTKEDSVKFYVNGVETASVTTGLPNDEQLALSLSNMAGEGAANNLTVDWMYAAQIYEDVR